VKNKVSNATSAFGFVANLYLKKVPYKIIAECILSALKSILVVINSVWLLEALIEIVVDEQVYSRGIKLLILVTGINIFVSVIQNMYNYCIKYKSDLKIRQYLEKLIMTHAEKLPLKYYENSEFYTIVKQAEKAATVTIFSAYNDLIQLLGNVAALISAVIVAVNIAPGLLLFVVFTLPMILVSKKYGKLFSEKNVSLIFWERKKQYARDAWMNKEFARITKITNAWKIIDKHYEEGYTGGNQIHKESSRALIKWNFLTTEFSITFIMIVCYIYGIFASVYNDGFSISGFSVMFVAVMNMISRVRKIYKQYENFCGYRVEMQPLHTFLKLNPEDEHAKGIQPGEFRSLEFRNVWFSYDNEKWALEDVSFKIEAGEKTVILGYNGAGKSTLIKLLLRLYDVDKGEILYNGVNIKQLSLQGYREKFAAAFQDFRLFSISLAENIKMNECTDEDKEKIKDALVQLDKEPWINDMDRLIGREYETEGLVLSGGQQQWLAVTRLYFHNFEIAVLDEPSAALDPISAKQMQTDVEKLIGNRSMIMISHDMAAANSADRILFFENGRLIAQGTHKEVLEENIQYAEFYNCQANNYRSV